MSSLLEGTPNYVENSAKCWYGIGWCYYFQNRYLECIVALERFDKEPYIETDEAVEASMRKLSALQKLKDFLEDPEIANEFERYKK